MTIGVFDSGLGGLLTARYIKTFAPEVRILYYGDTAHLPYGDKSSWQVQAYAREIVRFLLEAGAQGIVIACNSFGGGSGSSLGRSAGKAGLGCDFGYYAAV